MDSKETRNAEERCFLSCSWLHGILRNISVPPCLRASVVFCYFCCGLTAALGTSNVCLRSRTRLAWKQAGLGRSWLAKTLRRLLRACHTLHPFHIQSGQGGDLLPVVVLVCAAFERPTARFKTRAKAARKRPSSFDFPNLGRHSKPEEHRCAETDAGNRLRTRRAGLSP